MTRFQSSPVPALLGSVALFASLSAPLLADIVQADDVIVDGSLCVGFDCVSGEAFGDDTIRLKENNLRIRFQDTSASGSFPTRDWRLVANDSGNGGQEYLAIEDVDANRQPFKVIGGAPANALLVSGSGRIGMGTANPAVEMHVASGDSPTLRLEQNASSGFSAQTWDLAGNETNFFVRDVTNGSQLPFRIRPGADSNSLYIDADNDVGLGTSSPDVPLHVQRSSGALLDMAKFENNGDIALILNNTAAGAATPEWKVASFNGDFFIGTPTSAGIEFLLSNSGDLTISGNFISGGTTLNVPDYVFKDDYELMTLAQVDAFIETNGHLPRIPSAGDIAQGGINLSEMQMALLEKIEELTLYTLEQHRQISALEAEMAAVVRR